MVKFNICIVAFLLSFTVQKDAANENFSSLHPKAQLCPGIRISFAATVSVAQSLNLRAGLFASSGLCA